MPATVPTSISSQPMQTVQIISIKGDDSYVTGGYALAAADLDPAAGGAGKAIWGVNDGSTVIALWDAANKKVKFITAATGAEVGSASNQTANTVKLIVQG